MAHFLQQCYSKQEKKSEPRTVNIIPIFHIQSEGGGLSKRPIAKHDRFSFVYVISDETATELSHSGREIVPFEQNIVQKAITMVKVEADKV